MVEIDIAILKQSAMPQSNGNRRNVVIRPNKMIFLEGILVLYPARKWILVIDHITQTIGILQN